MNRKEVFLKNLEIFCQRVPFLSEALENVSTDHLELSETKKEETNLKQRIEGKTYYFHSNYSAATEALKWAESLELDGEGVLYLFGIGLGYYYDAIKEWLKGGKERYLVFLEDDLAVLSRFLEMENAPRILEDSQVFIHYLGEAVQGRPQLVDLCWSFVSLPRKVSALNYYQQTRAKDFAQLNFELLSEGASQDTLVKEFNNSGNAFFRNFYFNTLLLKGSHHGNKLFGKFRGMPAVICGAGPSLNKNIQQLKSLRDEALVLSGGSALNVLDDSGLLPHFGAGVDPNDRVFHRMEFKNFKELPFFYYSRFNHKSLKSLTGARLYISGSSFYPVSEWVEEELGIKGDKLKGGYSVLNLCMEIACSLGCNPIILTGMDLAYTDGYMYADGVKEIPGEEKTADLKDPNIVVRKDIYGKSVFTHWKWIHEARWISELAQKNPEVTFINATEGGLGFENIQNRTLQEVIKEALGKKYNIEGIIRKELQECSLHDVTSEKIECVLSRLMESLDRCMDIFDKGLLVLDEKSKALAEGELIEEGPDSALLEVKEEIAFQKLIKEISQVLEQKIIRKTYQIKNDKELRNHQQRELGIIELEKERLNFYKKVTADNIKKLKGAFSGKEP